MDVSLTAKLKNFSEFYSLYRNGDERELYQGKSLLFHAISNNDPDSRYEISTFLLKKGVDARETNDSNETLLHILLSRVHHNLDQTVILCRELMVRGADVHQLDNKGRSAFQYILNTKYTDDELEPLYDLWFSQEGLRFDTPNAWGKTLLQLARMLPFRETLVERMQDYQQKHLLS